MLITRRGFGALGLGGIAAAGMPGTGLRARADEGVIREYATSLVGTPMHGPGFSNFIHSNPDAPKGGTLRLARPGTFDSFNYFVVRGDAPVQIYLLCHDTLMAEALDESQSTQYGLAAEWMEHPKDYSWAAFRLRDEARFHDGRPVTVEDLIFAFNILKAEGQPLYRYYYGNVVEARDMGDRVIRFDFDQTGNRELPHILGQLPVMPKHWWEGRSFADGTLDPILTSGPYKIGEFEPGRFFELVRVEDYWAKDLPINRGAWNFDVLHYEYFLDPEATFDAFRAGVVDFRQENSARRWAEDYGPAFPAVAEGRVVREEPVLQGSQVVQTFVLNLRREKFQDLRVRKAISLAYDFEWTNNNIYFGQYARPRSYFQVNGESDLMPSAPPDALELEVLEPLRDKIPPEVFGAPYEAPKTDGSGRNRRQLREASRLLAEAGWRPDGGVLKNAAGEIFTLEFLTQSASRERDVQPFLDNLGRLGIQTTFRLVDAAQYTRRTQQDDTFPFDMIGYIVLNSESPGNEQRNYWGSAAAMNPGWRGNVAGVQDEAVDALIEKIIFAPDRERLAAASRALDRVLAWNHYMIFQIYTPYERIAYWNKFGHPDPLPPYRLAVSERWWFDAEKARKLQEGG